MGRSQESFNKKEVRNKKEKKRKEKEKKRQARREEGKDSFNDMIAYVDEYGQILDTPPDPDQKEEIELEDIEPGVPKKSEMEEEETERKGVVTFFNENKGFGFIKDMKTQQSVFVHVSNLEESIKENNLVLFEMEKGPKGPVAVKVKLQKK